MMTCTQSQVTQPSLEVIMTKEQAYKSGYAAYNQGGSFPKENPHPGFRSGWDNATFEHAETMFDDADVVYASYNAHHDDF